MARALRCSSRSQTTRKKWSIVREISHILGALEEFPFIGKQREHSGNAKNLSGLVRIGRESGPVRGSGEGFISYV